MVEKLIGYESEIKENKILSVQMNLLNKCTSKCISCKKHTWPDDKLNLEDVKQAIDVLSDSFGLKTMVLSGGDPILYEDIIDVLSHLEEKGILSSMITTGITKDKKVINVISDSLYRIHLSLDACTYEDYKNIRGVDAFDIVDKNIYKISQRRRERGLSPIRLSSTISKLNYDKVYKLYRYAVSHGCAIKFFLVHTFEDLYMNDKEIGSFYSQLEFIVKDEARFGIISNAKELLNSMFKEQDPVNCACYVPYISCVINANGDIYPCCRVFKDNGFYEDQRFLSYGNIVGKDKTELIREFNYRLKYFYPIANNEECQCCGQRYQDLLQHLCKIKEPDKREALFI